MKFGNLDKWGFSNLTRQKPWIQGTKFCLFTTLKIDELSSTKKNPLALCTIFEEKWREVKRSEEKWRKWRKMKKNEEKWRKMKKNEEKWRKMKKNEEKKISLRIFSDCSQEVWFLLCICLYYLNKQDLAEWKSKLFRWTAEIHVFKSKLVIFHVIFGLFSMKTREYLPSNGTVSTFTQPDLVYLSNIIRCTAEITPLAKNRRKLGEIFYFFIFLHFSSFFFIFLHFSSFFFIFLHFSSDSSLLFTSLHFSSLLFTSLQKLYKVPGGFFWCWTAHEKWEVRSDDLSNT